MFPQRLEERRAWLRRGFSAAVEYALLHEAHLFLQVGDLFDSPEPRNVERQFVAEALAALRAAGIRSIGIGGNHDTPRSRGGAMPATAVGTFAPLGGLRLLGDGGSGGEDAELLDIEGVRVAVGGIAPNPLLPPGSDPLDGIDWRPNADLSILLVHASLEEHVFPGAPEPIIRRETVERLGVDCLLAGHVHRFAAFRWSTTTVVVPGATEQMTFGEMGNRPGFVYLEMEPGRPPELQHVEFEPQPRAQIVVQSADLSPDDPAETVLERLRSAADSDAMVRLSLEGPITRQRYHDLRLRELAEFGAARYFFLDLDTSGLYVDGDLPSPAARSGRLSPREELVRYGEEVRAAAQTASERALIDEAMRAILSEYE